MMRGVLMLTIAASVTHAFAQPTAGVKSIAARFDDLLHRGFALHQQARFAEAIPLLAEAQKLQPADYFANLLLGIDLLRTGKPALAIPRLKTAAKSRPHEEIPEAYLGEAQAALGQNAAAAEAFQRAVERSKHSEDSLDAWAGFALERFRQIGETLRSSQEGVVIAHRLETNNHPEPAADCKQSISFLERRLATHSPVHSPGAPLLATPRFAGETYYKLSFCYAQEAGVAAAQLQSTSGDAAAVYRLRGDILLRLKGDAKAAQSEYVQALALHPNDPALLERLAEAEWSSGDVTSATASAQKALAIDPHRRAALRTLATIALENREYDKALPWLRELIAEQPGDTATAVQLARALAQTPDGSDHDNQHAAEALKYLQPALAKGFPDEKGALHAQLARLLRALGHDAEATIAAAEAKRLSDAFQAHRVNLQQSSGDHDGPQ